MNADITSQNNQYQEIQRNGEEQEKMEKIFQVEENVESQALVRGLADFIEVEFEHSEKS